MDKRGDTFQEERMVECALNLRIPAALRYSLVGVNLVQTVFATLGNILVIALVINEKRLRTRSNAFLVSLAVSDLMIGAAAEPLLLAQMLSQELRENCRFNGIRRYLSTLLMGASIGSIALISYDRWTHLSKTVRYNDFMPKKKVAALISIAWLIPLVVSFIFLGSEAVYNTTVITHVLLTTTVIITCYLVIVRIARTHDASLRMRSEVKAYDRRKAHHIRVAKATALVISCLMVTFIPISIFHGLTAINGLGPGSVRIPDETKEICYSVLLTILMANSGINPVIYCFKIPEFRSSMKKMFGMSNGRQLENSMYSQAESMSK